MEQKTVGNKPEPSAGFRWLVLVVISFAMFGNYYIYDCMPPIADLLRSQLGFSNLEIGSLKTLYHTPNIILVLLGGILIDKIGTKKSMILFGTISMIGVLLFVMQGKYITMAVGWFVFGAGAESLIVAVTTSIARWFKGKELSFAFGLNLTVARLGSATAEVSPSWASSYFTTWDGPMIFAVIAGAITLAAVIIYLFLDNYATKKYTLGEFEQQDKIDFKGLFKFKPTFWFIVLLCVTFYSAIFPFQHFATMFFQDVHNVSRATAGSFNAMPFWFAIVLTPLFGLLVDKIGRRSTLMMVGSFLIIPIHLGLFYTDISPYIFMGVLGVAFSLVPAIMWPSVAMIINPKRLGTAYGVMTMMQNIGLNIFNSLAGWLNDATGNYQAMMLMFASLGLFGLIFSILLRKSEAGPNSHGLELPKKN